MESRLEDEKTKAKELLTEAISSNINEGYCNAQ